MLNTILLNDLLQMFGHQITKSSLVRRAEFVRKDHGRVDDVSVYEFECLEVAFETVSDQNGVFVEQLEQVRLHLFDIFVGIFEAILGQATPARVIVEYFGAGLDERFVDFLHVKIDDAHACQLETLGCVAHLTVERVDVRRRFGVNAAKELFIRRVLVAVLGFHVAD